MIGNESAADTPPAQGASIPSEQILLERMEQLEADLIKVMVRDALTRNRSRLTETN